MMACVLLFAVLGTGLSPSCSGGRLATQIREHGRESTWLQMFVQEMVDRQKSQMKARRKCPRLLWIIFLSWSLHGTHLTWCPVSICNVSSHVNPRVVCLARRKDLIYSNSLFSSYALCKCFVKLQVTISAADSALDLLLALPQWALNKETGLPCSI